MQTVYISDNIPMHQQPQLYNIIQRKTTKIYNKDTHFKHFMDKNKTETKNFKSGRLLSLCYHRNVEVYLVLLEV